MKTKTTDLTGKALDYMVGVAVGKHVEPFLFAWDYIVVDSDWNAYSPTTNWGQLGPLLEIAPIKIEVYKNISMVTVSVGYFEYVESHSDPKVAACRAIVAAKLGDQVDVPEVLL